MKYFLEQFSNFLFLNIQQFFLLATFTYSHLFGIYQLLHATYFVWKETALKGVWTTLSFKTTKVVVYSYDEIVWSYNLFCWLKRDSDNRNTLYHLLIFLKLFLCFISLFEFLVTVYFCIFKHWKRKCLKI